MLSSFVFFFWKVLIGHLHFLYIECLVQRKHLFVEQIKILYINKRNLFSSEILIPLVRDMNCEHK